VSRESFIASDLPSSSGCELAWSENSISLIHGSCSTPLRSSYEYQSADRGPAFPILGGYLSMRILRRFRRSFSSLIHELLLVKFLHRSDLFQLTGRSYRLGSSENNSRGAKAPTGSDADTITADKASKGAKS